MDLGQVHAKNPVQRLARGEAQSIGLLRSIIAARHAMTRVETSTLRLTGRTLHRWSIDGGTSVADMIRNVCTNPTDRLVAGAQPNYLYALAQDQQEPVNSAQYAPEKLRLLDAHRLASGNKVLVAMIDSEADGSHPDLAGAITATFEASADDEKPHSHGTGMAGAIAAHRTMLGTAPRVGARPIRGCAMRSPKPTKGAWL